MSLGARPGSWMPPAATCCSPDGCPGYDRVPLPSSSFDGKASTCTGWLCSTGWIVHWGESMVNTSAAALVDHTRELLHTFRDTASVSLYVAHGGTNFGFWAGALTCRTQTATHFLDADPRTPPPTPTLIQAPTTTRTPPPTPWRLPADCYGNP